MAATQQQQTQAQQPPPQPNTSWLEFSAPFCAAVEATFFEAQRRQHRHCVINERFTTPDSSWQVSLPERLIGFSGLGLFAFDFFATSMHDELLFVDANHPMVRHGRIDVPGQEAAISRLRAQRPGIPEIDGSGVRCGDDALIHAICSLAAVETGALFYYRCPNSAVPGSATWVLIKHAVDPATLTSVPSNLVALAPPSAEFGTYDARVRDYDAKRPQGGAARLNEFRINFLQLMSLPMPTLVTTRALYVGFLEANGYTIREQPPTPSSDGDGEIATTWVDLVAVLADGQAGLTATFDDLGRLRVVNMVLDAAAYADDGYGL